MVAKARQIASDSPKAEVGEIDTSAPFESVKAAVSLFGEGAFSVEKSTARRPKPQSAERPFAKETDLHLAQKDLNRLKEQLRNAEATRVQALSELEKAKITVEELTNKLEAVNKSKETSLVATEAAKAQTKQVEEMTSNGGTGPDVTSRQELDAAREQYAVAITQLDAAKQELRTIRKEFDASLEAKVSAFQQESEAKRSFDSNKEKAAELLKKITASHESLVHVKLATEQAQQEESNIRLEKDARRQSYMQASEETGKKLASLKKEFDPELKKNIEVKLAETSSEIEAIQKKMENARISEAESTTTVTAELDGAKGVLQKLAYEENSLKSLLESLKLELKSVKKDHSELKEKDSETESLVGSLHVQLQKCKSELEAAISTESKASLAADDLTLTLHQLSAESEAATQESESTRRKTEELRQEADAVRAALSEAEKKLKSTLMDAEEAKAAEARALDQIKELSERANASRSSASEHGAKITISVEEHGSLSRKVKESEELAEMKVAAAAAQAEAVRASENEAVKRMEAARKEMEAMAAATEVALKRAEMAESAKKAVEGELLRWREREQQKKAAEAASRILSVTATTPPESLMARIPATVVKTEVRQKVYRPTVSKKALLPSLSSVFHRRKSQADGGMPSYLPGEKHTRLTICEGEDGTESSNGDVLIFPDMIRYRQLTHSDVDNFVEEVIVKDTEWLPGTVETMTGSHVFVCAHGSRDRRCGVCGPVLIEKFKEEINSRGLQGQVFVSPCSHIGGHKYAGNVIIFSPNISGKVSGHWYGYVTPTDVPILLEQHIGKGKIIEHLWRGEMGLSAEDQKELHALRSKTLQATETNGFTNSTTNGGGGCCQGIGNSSCCQNTMVKERGDEPKIAEKDKANEPELSEDNKGVRARKLCGMPAWFESWERENTYVTLAVVAAAASVAVAYSCYKQMK